MYSAPLVTIVTPSLNQGRFIREAIESVLQQDYPAIEYIVMDACSTDDTAAVVADYEGRLRFVCEPDRGQSHAINKGWRMGRGEIVAWLNADDVLLPGAVTAAVAEFARSPDAALVYGDGEFIDADGTPLWCTPSGEPDVWRLINVSDYILQPAAFMRRKNVEEVGFVDETNNWSMDWDLFLRIALRAPMAYVPQRFALLRVYDETKTMSGGRARFRELVRLMRRYGTCRYPPGYFVYGVDTYQRLAHHALGRTPRVLSPVAESLGRLVDATGRAVVRRAMRPYERRLEIARGAKTKSEEDSSAGAGWFSDGWASPLVTRALPLDGPTLRVRGHVPEYPKLTGQVLSVECGGVVIARQDLPFGEFVLDAAVPDEVRGRTVEVRLRAERSFVPKRERINADKRRLSYYLDELCTIAASGTS